MGVDDEKMTGWNINLDGQCVSEQATNNCFFASGKRSRLGMKWPTGLGLQAKSLTKKIDIEI
jgi:hypothetical protein